VLQTDPGCGCHIRQPNLGLVLNDHFVLPYLQVVYWCTSSFAVLALVSSVPT